MVDYIRSDLEAILFHIKIAEANARGQRLFGPDPDGEIVITRNGVANVVAELDNFEEIRINTGAGNDTVTGVDDFRPTSLFFNTITVNGDRATIDASLMTSAHRLVLNASPEELAQIATMPAATIAALPEFEGLSRAALTGRFVGPCTTSIASTSAPTDGVQTSRRRSIRRGARTIIRCSTDSWRSTPVRSSSRTFRKTSTERCISSMPPII